MEGIGSLLCVGLPNVDAFHYKIFQMSQLFSLFRNVTKYWEPDRLTLVDSGFSKF
jgi:hypothetical protein